MLNRVLKIFSLILIPLSLNAGLLSFLNAHKKWAIPCVSLLGADIAFRLWQRVEKEKLLVMSHEPYESAYRKTRLLYLEGLQKYYFRNCKILFGIGTVSLLYCLYEEDIHKLYNSGRQRINFLIHKFHIIH